MQKHVAINLLFFSILFVTCLDAQQKDSLFHFSGSVVVTNNGIAIVPSLALGKPAAILYLTTGKGRLSFDPELRFALDGKPWAFYFWGRYKMVQTPKFKLTLGMNAAVTFKTLPIQLNGVTRDGMIAVRSLGIEVVPNYSLTRNITIGTYYLYTHGFDNLLLTNGHFVNVNSSISNIALPAKFSLRIAPQLYYLWLDHYDGYYASASIRLALPHSPVAISSILNKMINTDIPGSKNFDWNIGVIYSFHKTYQKK